MTSHSFYHAGSREMQDRFDSRQLADRMEQVVVRRAFTDEDRAFIAKAAFFFLATADAVGQPDCSYKGGVPGFVRVMDGASLAFPGYDGNGMFRSLGNLRVNPHVGLLFIDFESPQRLRVNGVAAIADQDPLLGTFPGAQTVVRIAVKEIFPNCPRYIHPMTVQDLSVHAPRPDYTPPDAKWKTFDVFRDALPARDKSPAG